MLKKLLASAVAWGVLILIIAGVIALLSAAGGAVMKIFGFHADSFSSIFLFFLLAVILIIGTEPVRLWAVVAMILSIATYFWRLHPTIKKLDAMGCITPKGYSKALGWMITGFMAMFTLALAAHILMKVM